MTPRLVSVDCRTMFVTRWVGHSCTHKGYRIDIRPTDAFTKAQIEQTIEEFRSRPHNLVVTNTGPEAA